MSKVNKEEIQIIHSPRKDFRFLSANRIINDAHVKSLMSAFLCGEWIPPIFVTKDGYIVDGQNRYSAFCQLCKKQPSEKFSLRVLTINSNESPIDLAIRFNTGQKKWLANDYFHTFLVQGIASYIRLAEFMGEYKELKGVRSALQIIKGSYTTKIFQNGSLEISELEVMYAKQKMDTLRKVSKHIKTSVCFSCDTIIAFYSVYPKVKDWKIFYKKLSNNFKMPYTKKCSDWLLAYEKCLD